MPGLMSGERKRSTVSGPQRLQLYAWTAPDLPATAPAPDSTPLSCVICRGQSGVPNPRPTTDTAARTCSLQSTGT
jgi:hypothetical protein